MPGDQVNTSMTQDEIATASQAAICPEPTDGSPYCYSKGLVDATGHLITNPAPAGYGPSQLRSAYKITGSGSSSMYMLAKAGPQPPARSLEVSAKILELPPEFRQLGLQPVDALAVARTAPGRRCRRLLRGLPHFHISRQ